MPKLAPEGLSPRFSSLLPPTSYRVAHLPLVAPPRGVSRLTLLRQSGVSISEQAEIVFRRIEQRGMDFLHPYAILVRSADIPARERNCEAMRKKCKEHDLSCAPLSLISSVALHVHPRELSTLGVKWLVCMHHRVKISEKERGYFVLAVSEQAYTLTVCHGTSKWAEGVAFLLARYPENVPQLEVSPAHEHAEPSY